MAQRILYATFFLLFWNFVCACAYASASSLNTESFEFVGGCSPLSRHPSTSVQRVHPHMNLETTCVVRVVLANNKRAGELIARVCTQGFRSRLSSLATLVRSTVGTASCTWAASRTEPAPISSFSAPSGSTPDSGWWAASVSRAPSSPACGSPSNRHHLLPNPPCDDPSRNCPCVALRFLGSIRCAMQCGPCSSTTQRTIPTGKHPILPLGQ